MARSLLLGCVVAAALAAAGCTGTGAASGGRSTAPVPTPPSSGQPVDETRPDIMVDGTHFVTADGAQVLLRGVAIHSLDPVVYERAPELGGNVVRLAVAWSDYEPSGPRGDTHSWDASRLADLDAEISFLGQHGIQVLVDMHQYGWSPYFASLQRGGRANGIPKWVYHGRRFALTKQGLEAAQARMYTDRRATELYGEFAAMLAERYRTTPNVLGYEILNEPPLGNMPRRGWAVQRIIRWQARVATAIRAVDQNRAIVFMVPPRTDVRSVKLHSLERLGHLVLDVHDYYAGTGDRARTTLQGSRYRGTLAEQTAYLAPYISIARAWNVPLFVGEWGAFPSEPGVDVYQRQMVTLFAREGISWTRWSLDRTERLGLLDRNGDLTSAAVQLGRLIQAQPQPPV